jgi:hypothetical protein
MKKITFILLEDITACLEKWRTYSENSKAIEEA